MGEVLQAGGHIQQREIATREELVTLNVRVVLNCTGFGAKTLFGDDELTPIRGQLVIVPRDDGILLGGTYERGATHLTPEAETSIRIIIEHARMAATMRV